MITTRWSGLSAGAPITNQASRGLTDREPFPEVFRRMADDLEQGGSSLYARLARAYADDPRLERIAGDHEPRWEVPLRVFAAVHHLALTGRVEDPWSSFGDVVEGHADELARFVAEQPVQTNEVQRCWGLLPGFLSAANGSRRFSLVELGPSAGLNLFWDHYRYRYPNAVWGPVDAPIELTGRARDGPPAELFERDVEIVQRLGIDRHPVDVADEAGARLLEAFVWADQTERIERLRRAVELVRRDPPELVQGDYVELLPKVLAERRDDALTVVYHSASVLYLSRAERKRLRKGIEKAARRGPLAWLSYESVEDKTGPYLFALDLQTWPGGERRRLARLDGHANRLEWLP